MLLLPEPDLFQLLRTLTKAQCERAIRALEESLRAFSADETTSNAAKLIHQPHRTVIPNAQNDSSVLFMPSSDSKNAAVKIVTLSSRGALGVINIFSPDGTLLGLLSADEVTAFRTALASLSLLRRCRSMKKDNIVIFGAGRQAEWHARLCLLLLPSGAIKCITFVNRSRKRLEELAATILAELHREYPDVRVETLVQEEAMYAGRLKATIASSNVIFTCTPSTIPLFPSSYLEGKLSQGRFISLIGSYRPEMHEVDTATLLSGNQVYVDGKIACMREAGELITAGVQESELIELGCILNSEEDMADLEIAENRNIIFKCVGMGIMDLAVGRVLLDLGSELGIGIQVDRF
ncbi:hypothetical protein CNMCM8694_002084 [Aspergillus lentulus]|nr:hypothetical protein CNMCM8060_002428 [Aspergillus lentulus]KAF4191279.1 hypothetical protein CNMCM8694_002084 [Aspergillus lentulus]